MTEKTKSDIRVTLVLMAFAGSMMLLSLGCEKKCSVGEVRVNGKCYVPGVSYLRANGVEKIV